MKLLTTPLLTRMMPAGVSVGHARFLGPGWQFLRAA